MTVICWLQPATTGELERLTQAGVRRLLVLCPAFVADCLETLKEIAIAGRKTFLAAGGESFTLIPTWGKRAVDVIIPGHSMTSQ